jgi:hypothetical protein
MDPELSPTAARLVDTGLLKDDVAASRGSCSG